MENYPKLLTRYSAEVEQFVDWLNGDARLDRNDIAVEAHKMAGNAALFGATGFRDALATIERAARAGEDAQVMSAIATLPQIWKRSKKALFEITPKE